MAKKINEEIYFYGGLDTDSDEKFVKQGDYVDALNFIGYGDSDVGVRQNLKGNVLTYNKKITVGNEFICGRAYYKNNRSHILFIYETTGSTVYNKIIEYNPQIDDTTILIRQEEPETITSDYLNFLSPYSNDYFIKADILGDWLSWTDNRNEPRMVNIADLKDYSTNPGGGYTALIKTPPKISPVVDTYRDTSVDYNNIDGAFQFKYRYIYDDYRRSVFTSASILAVDEKNVRVYDDPWNMDNDNYISIGIDVGASYVRFIEIIGRKNNTGNWYKIVTIDKTNTNEMYSTANGATAASSPLTNGLRYYYKFYNDKSYAAISLEDAVKPYDSVPEKCETLSFFGDNRLVLAGYTDGKDLPDIDVSLTVGYEASPTIFFGWDCTYERTDDVLGTGYAFEIKFDWDDISSGGNARTEVYPNDHVHFNFSGEEEVDTGSGTADQALIYELDEYVVFNSHLSSISDILDYLVANTSDPSNTGTVAGSWNISKQTGNILRFRFVASDVSYDFVGAISASNSSLVQNRAYEWTNSFATDQGFSSYRSHQLALIYYDKRGRKYPALTSDDMRFSVEGRGDRTNKGIAYVSYDLSSQTAPFDAVAYRWAYAYRSRNFIQVVCSWATKIQNDDGETNDRVLALEVSARGDYFPSNYTYEEGDKIRILRGTYNSGNFTTGGSREYVVKEVLDTITDSGGEERNGKWLIVDTSIISDALTLEITLFYNALIEVYKVNKSFADDVLYYEIGEMGTCIGGVHTPSTGKLNQGDIWFYPKIFYGSANDDIFDNLEVGWANVESPYLNEADNIKINGIADVNVEFNESIEKYSNFVGWSNQLLQDTQVNGLSTFDVFDRKEISYTYGKIKGLEELGNSLVILCEEKILSTFVGATEYTDASGNTNVVKSNNVLGYVRPHAESYGTFFKESIVNTGKYIYFCDILDGSIIRKAVNGLFPISGISTHPNGVVNYKMKSYFKELMDNIVGSLHNDSANTSLQNGKCYMGYDPYHNHLYVTFFDKIDTNNCVSLIFDESINRWVTKYTAFLGLSDYGSMYLSTDTDLYHFTNGQSAGLYRLNADATDADRIELYGFPQESYIQFVTHEAPNIVKLFNSMGIHADSQWTVESIEIEPTSNYPNGMYSEVLDSDFVEEEGVYRAYMPRNMKTRTSTANNYDRINGDELRGYVMKIKLSTENTDKTELFKVDINSELSP